MWEAILSLPHVYDGVFLQKVAVVLIFSLTFPKGYGNGLRLS